MIFAIKSKRQFHFLRVANFMDLSIFFVFLVRIFYEFMFFRNRIQDSMPDQVRNEVYFANIYIEQNFNDRLDAIYCCISTLLWLRIIILFKLTRFLGPLVKMIQNMLLDI